MNKAKLKKITSARLFLPNRVSDRGPSDQCDQDSGLL